MNTNNHLCLTSVFVVACSLLSSCSTTGDPTQRNELQARKEASSSLQDKESINAAIKDIEAELGNM